MAHPDLMTGLFKDVLRAHDCGAMWACIHPGGTLYFVTTGQMDEGDFANVILRKYILVALHADELVEAGEAYWERQDGTLGIVFHDENEFIPLADLGLSKGIGFYRISQFPDERNDASCY